MPGLTRRGVSILAFSAFAVYTIYNFQLYLLFPVIPQLTFHPDLLTTISGLLRTGLPVDSNLPSPAARQPYSRHIVAVGDLHGDLPNARRVLEFSGVTDEDGNWTGGVDFFVQTGDIIDRGDDTIPLFTWMEQLRTQAPSTGGTVVSILGNHEWMNALGDWRYVYPSEIQTFGGVAPRQKLITTGFIGRTWAKNYTTTARLPLHPSIGEVNTPFPPPNLHQREDAEPEYYDKHKPLSHAAISFVHGGLSPTYSQLTPYPSRINELSDSLLAKVQNRKQPPPHPPNRYPGLPSDATHEEHELYDADGPLWYRGWATDSEEKACKDVERVLAKTGTRRMIMGHTPDFENIVSRCNGKIIIIDTGISHAYGGVLSALSIHYTLTPIDGGKGNKWMERELISAIYYDRQEVLVVEEREITGDFQVPSD